MLTIVGRHRTRPLGRRPNHQCDRVHRPGRALQIGWRRTCHEEAPDRHGAVAFRAGTASRTRRLPASGDTLRMVGRSVLASSKTDPAAVLVSAGLASDR